MNVMVDFAIKNKKEIENACKELDQLSGGKRFIHANEDY